MKNLTISALLLISATFVACEGMMTMNSQSSSRTETNISENSETVSNGDTTYTNKNRKEKTSSESDSKTRIGFDVEDKTGISDEVRENLKKRRQGNDTDDEVKKDTSENKKPKQTNEKTSYKGNLACPTAIADDSFENLKTKIEKVQMDADRLRKGKELFNENCVTSKQAQMLVASLNLENYKLEFARFLYGRTVDKDNFMRVTKEFSFENTKKKLESFISE